MLDYRRYFFFLMNNSRSPSISSLNQVPMNEIELKFAKSVTQKMKNYPISAFFLNPIDPVRDKLPNYLQAIKPNVPMDLSTVGEKLDKNVYKTIEDWKKDMNMIWANALLYNPRGSPYAMVAEELKSIFKRKTETIPKTEIDEWFLNVRKVNKKIMKAAEGRLLINYTPNIKPPKVPSNRKKQKQENIFD